MKIKELALEVKGDQWRYGFIDDEDVFHEVLCVRVPTGFPVESKYAAMPLNEALEKGLAWVSSCEDSEDVVNAMLLNLSHLEAEMD